MRGRLQQTLDFGVEISGDSECSITPVWGNETGHRVVEQVDSVGALVDEDRYRRIRCGIGNGLDHLFHDERISDDEAESPASLSASFLSPTSPMSKRANSIKLEVPTAA